jgi:hypothetical protein
MVVAVAVVAVFLIVGSGIDLLSDAIIAISMVAMIAGILGGLPHIVELSSLQQVKFSKRYHTLTFQVAKAVIRGISMARLLILMGMVTL